MARPVPLGLWPAIAAASPVLVPALGLRNQRYRAKRALAGAVNRSRLDHARHLELPALRSLEISVLVEEATLAGFEGDPGVSYLIRTDRGAVLFDVGLGPETPTLARNAKRLDVELDDAEALVISHLHAGHIGGRKARRSRAVSLSHDVGFPSGLPCYLPERASAPGLDPVTVTGPRLLAAGLATTGPLARSLFFTGLIEEQALIGRLSGKGLVVVTGCAHPTVELILAMVRRLSEEPIYAVVGGMHLPMTRSRQAWGGLQLQMLTGTGKPPWERIDERDLARAVNAIDEGGTRRVLLSAHDSCDVALERLADRLRADVEVLRAGGTYSL